jgi:ammonia channel protein AmtB
MISRAALVCGGLIRDVPVGRFLIFITFWSLLVYNPVARWSWHWAGWSNQYGVMDFAGGTAVHITSGTAVLAFSVFYEIDKKGVKRCWNGFWRIFTRRLRTPLDISSQLRQQSIVRPRGMIRPGATDDQDSDEHETEHQLPNGRARSDNSAANDFDDPEAGRIQPTLQPAGRLGLGPEADHPPHNVNNMVLGTALLWIGWFGFNGGSALGGNLRAVSACVSTHIAACSGGTTSLLISWISSALARAGADEGAEQHHKVPSVTHFCDGAVIGLVAITPAAGYVGLNSFDRCFRLIEARSQCGALAYLELCQRLWCPC